MPENCSILIVEDEPLISMMLEDLLDSLGHRAASCCDTVAEAMARVDEGGFELAIIDVHLKGGEHVWPVADRLADEGIPYILSTGGHIEPPPARHAGAPTLAKPYTVEAIAAAIDEARAIQA